MDTSRQLRRLAGLAISALAFTGCAATMRVSSFSERGIDLAQYRTYGWDAADRQTTGDPRLDNNPFFHERIRAEVENQLAAKGLAKLTLGTPDLLVHVHASINQRIDPNGADARFGYGADRGYGSPDDRQPSVYDAGTIVLDFVDTRTNTVVWRGWAEGSMDRVIDNQAWMDEKIDQAVAGILSKFPRGVYSGAH